MVDVKVVDAILISGTFHDFQKIFSKIQEGYNLGTIIFGPAVMNFYGLKISHSENGKIYIYADEKL